MDELKLQNITKAIIQGSSEPVMLDDVVRAFEDCDEVNVLMIKTAIEKLMQEEDATQELKNIAGGYQYHIKQEYAEWIQLAHEIEVDVDKLPRALTETLAIIAYKQPIARSEIEAIRGCQTHLTVYNQLEDRCWIRVVEYGGERNAAALYGTTSEFLEYFGLNSVFDLPDLETLEVSEEMLQCVTI